LQLVNQHRDQRHIRLQLHLQLVDQRHIRLRRHIPRIGIPVNQLRQHIQPHLEPVTVQVEGQIDLQRLLGIRVKQLIIRRLRLTLQLGQRAGQQRLRGLQHLELVTVQVD
jgi:hypothetical protein